MPHWMSPMAIPDCVPFMWLLQEAIFRWHFVCLCLWCICIRHPPHEPSHVLIHIFIIFWLTDCGVVLEQWCCCGHSWSKKYICVNDCCTARICATCVAAAWARCVCVCFFCLDIVILHLESHRFLPTTPPVGALIALADSNGKTAVHWAAYKGAFRLQ